MSSLREEIVQEMTQPRVDKTRLYALLLKIVDSGGGGGGLGPMGPPGPAGPPGPKGERGPASEPKQSTKVEPKQSTKVETKQSSSKSSATPKKKLKE